MTFTDKFIADLKALTIFLVGEDKPTKKVAKKKAKKVNKKKGK